MTTSSPLFLRLICISVILYTSQVYGGQTDIDSLKQELVTASGINRVDILNQISEGHQNNLDSSFNYASQAEILAESLNYPKGQALAAKNKGIYYTRTTKYKKAITEFDLAINLYTKEDDKQGLLNTLYNKGKMCRMKGDYDQALYNFLESLRISEEIGDKKGVAYAYLNIGIIYATQMNQQETMGLPYFLDALEISQEINDKRCISYALNNIALVYIDLHKYDKALDYHEQSLKLKEAAGNKADIALSLGNIGDIYSMKEEYEVSIIYNRRALEIYREINEPFGVIYTLLEIGKAKFELRKFDEADPFLKEALAMAEDNNSLRLKKGTFLYLYQYYLEKKNFEQALEFFERFIKVKDSLFSENSSDQIAQMRTLYETEKKEAAINQLTSEKTIQDLKLKDTENMIWFFTVALFLTILLVGFVYYGYRLKRKANLLLEERNKFEIENKKRALSLFGQQVSKEVAVELLSDSFKSGSKKLFACIMFLDIRGFTPFVENKEPAEIIQYQNDVFGFMIDIISKHHGIINQFLGDGFMATFGAPVSTGNDCQNAVSASLEIVEVLAKKCGSGEVPKTKVGIGLHAGHIVTGNVGTSERKQYSVTGNTVILASRIEQLNKEYNSEILISKDVFDKLDGQQLTTENRWAVNLKGKSEPMEIIRLV